MINKLKTETRASSYDKKPIEALYKKLWKLKGSPSPNKLLKYNYKQHVDRMHEKITNNLSSMKKMASQEAEREEG